MSAPIRVVIIDDQRMFSDALGLMLEGEQDIELVGTATSAEQALARFADARFDLVLMDVDLPGMDGIEGTRRMREGHPDAQVVIITALRNTDVIARAIEAGASGYVSKANAAEQLLRVIRQAAAGEIIVPEAELLSTLSNLRQARQSRSDALRLMRYLTSREIEVLRYMAEGLSTAEISRRLRISRDTTRTHVRNLLAKLGVHSKLEAVSLAFHEGIVRPRADGSQTGT